MEGNYYLTRPEVNAAGGGITREPAAVWTARDDIQQKFIQLGRRLPYELPALYATQRGFTDPLFGNNEDRKKVKWYNPVDVVADFAKQSVINVAAITGTGALASGAFGRAKFYFDAPYINNPNLTLSQRQVRTANKFADLRVILEEVGQDFAKIAGETTKYMTSAGAAFNYAVSQGRQHQPGPAQALYSARHGGASALAASAGQSKLKTASEWAKSYFLGDQANSTSYGAIDAVPGLKGFSVGIKAFGQRFKDSVLAHDVVSGAQSFNNAVVRINSGNQGDAIRRLQESIQGIQSLHRSKFSSYAENVVRLMGKGGPGDGDIDSTVFSHVMRSNEYKNQLKRNLIINGIDESQADRFVRSIEVNKVPRSSRGLDDVTNRIRIGKVQSVAETGTDEFYENALTIFRKSNRNVDAAFTKDALKASIDQTDQLFVTRSFNRSLNRHVKSSWNTFYNDTVVPYGQTLLKPQKAVYQDFVGPLTSAKEEFLRRRAAQVLGIKLLDDRSRRVSNAIINQKLAQHGIDPNNFGQLRSFLMSNKAMTSRASSGGFNLFGMRQLLVDEGFTAGVFNYMKPEERDVVRNVASRLKINDPVSSSIGLSRLSGVYTNRSGDVIDLTKIKSMTSSLLDFGTQQFRIPVVRFNPLQMLGFGGPSGVSKYSPIQIAEGYSVQPFGKLESHAAEVFAWTKQKNGMFGPKGSLSFLGKDPTSLQPKTTQLKGLYNVVNPQYSNIFTRALSYMTNKKSISTTQISAAANGQQLSVKDRIKELFDVDEEQPNSLFRLLSRFRNRNVDLNNPKVLMNLVSNFGEDVNVGGSRVLRMERVGAVDDNIFQVVDDAGNLVYDHKAVLRAFSRFQRQPFSYGTPLPFMRQSVDELENLAATAGAPNPVRLNIPFLGRDMTPDEITNPMEALSFADELIATIRSETPVLRSRGVDTTGLTRRTFESRSSYKEI